VGRGRFGLLGQVGQGAEAGEDLREQVVAWWEAQGAAAGVADQAGGDGEQSPPQGGDHGLAAADTVPNQPPVQLPGRLAIWLLVVGGGEVVQPAGEGGGEQRGPHPGPVHRLVARGEVAQRGAVFGVAEQVLHLGPVAVPVLDLRGLVRVDTSRLVTMNE
jgi:hypothetical protein